MSGPTMHPRLIAGDAPDEATLPARARYRDDSRHVRFDECDESGRMRDAAVLRHAQDLAWIHSDQLEFSREWYAERGVGWVVRSIDLIVDDLPGPSAELVGTTALVGFRHVMARRRTRLFTAEDRVVADATIDWVMVDAKGRPTRFPAEFQSFVAEVGVGFEPTKISAYRNGTPDSAAPTEVATASTKVTVPIRRADIDPLGHVNNAAWLEIVDEALADCAPQLLAKPRRRVRLEYLGVTRAPAVTLLVGVESGTARVDASDETGAPLLRGIIEELL